MPIYSMGKNEHYLHAIYSMCQLQVGLLSHSIICSWLRCWKVRTNDILDVHFSQDFLTYSSETLRASLLYHCIANMSNETLGLLSETVTERCSPGPERANRLDSGPAEPTEPLSIGLSPGRTHMVCRTVGWSSFSRHEWLFWASSTLVKNFPMVLPQRHTTKLLLSIKKSQKLCFNKSVTYSFVLKSKHLVASDLRKTQKTRCNLNPF